MEGTQILLAIDPGLITGVAALPHGDLKPITGELEFGALMAYVEALAQNRSDPLVVVIEKFTITQATARNSQAPWSLMAIGAITWVCIREGLPEPVFQAPSAAMSFVPNGKLRTLGFWTKGGGGHANDAARHLVLYLVDKCGWRDPRAL